MINLDPPWHCCEHCDHQEPDYDPATWRHEDPCEHGCNDLEPPVSPPAGAGTTEPK